VNEKFGSRRKILSKGIREKEFAENAYDFFNRDGDWSLTEQDARFLGVDTEEAEIDNGWCEEFLQKYEDKRQVEGEAVLNQTTQRKGDYLGTPIESVSALLITLSASGEVALKADGDYVTNPGDVGRQVTGKGGIQDTLVDFEGGGDEIRGLVITITDDGVEPDEDERWIEALEGWLEDNSTSVKRTFRGVSREFGTDLSDLKAAVETAFTGGSISPDDLNDDVKQQAEQFDRGRKLFQGDPSLWSRFEEVYETMSETYSGAEVTRRMDGVSEDGVPESDGLEDLIQKANEHRTQELVSVYEEVADQRLSDPDPDDVLQEIEDWISSNEESLRALAENVTETFEDTDIDGMIAVLEDVWEGDGLGESRVIGSRTEFERISDAQSILGEGDLWSSLEDEQERLSEEYPQSPTTDEVGEMLESTELPSEEEVRDLLEEAGDPVTLEDLRSELEGLLEDLREEYPDDETTQRAIEVVEEDKTLDESEMKELVGDAEDLLKDDITERLEALEDGTVVLLDTE
jgi:hypothetical protein